MDPFSYLSVLISIILALGMTRVLAGVGEMLQARSHRRIYWVHAVWILNLFLYLVIAWWIFYRWRNQQPWTYFLFVFVLIAPTLLYLASISCSHRKRWETNQLITKRTTMRTIVRFSLSSHSTALSMLLILYSKACRIFSNKDHNTSLALHFFLLA